VTLPDVEATETLGAALAHEVQKGDILFLQGELGCGKTSLARGFLRRFFGNPSLDVPSPSYLLHFSYSSGASLPQSKEGDSAAVAAKSTSPSSDGAQPGHSSGQSLPATSVAFRAGDSSLVPGCAVHHIDPYRLPEGRIAALIDFEPIFAAIALVEWPERLGNQLVSDASPSRLEVRFEGFGPQADGRMVTLTGVGQRWTQLVQRWVAEGGPLRRLASLPDPEIADSDFISPSLLPLQTGIRNCRALPSEPRDWRVLGIESSCDDTGAAVLNGQGDVLGEALASQSTIHEEWGGVVPRLAQEGHRKAIDATVEEALRRANVTPEQLSAVAVTVGPGLGLCLEVGVRKALQIAAEHRLPLVRVHHMEAHTLVTRMPAARPSGITESSESEAKVLTPAFPFVTLLVSGGHNMAVLTRGVGQHTILGSTIDDSIGEAFDKTARILGITQVPGGPHLERLAKEGDATIHTLPKPLSKTRDRTLQKNCDFSFSGLKTAVRTLVEKQLPEATVASMTESELRSARANIAASFQSVAVAHLCERTTCAIEWARDLEPSLASLVVAGGVAANESVRRGLRDVAEWESLGMCCPPGRLCVDNGIMVAWAGVERLRLGLYEEPPSVTGIEHAVEIRPRWPLGDRDPRSQQSMHKGQKRKRPREDEGQAAPVVAVAG